MKIRWRRLLDYACLAIFAGLAGDALVCGRPWRALELGAVTLIVLFDIWKDWRIEELEHEVRVREQELAAADRRNLDLERHLSWVRP